MATDDSIPRQSNAVPASNGIMQLTASSTFPNITTEHTSFFTCASGRLLEPIFSVREGIPIEDAMNLASCFLDVARDSAYESADGKSSHQAHSAAYLIEMAKGIIDSVNSAVMRERLRHEQIA